MPIFGLGVLILWLGWFGFNAGSTIGTAGSRFAGVALVTNPAASAGVVGAAVTIAAISGRVDIGMVVNGALGAITAPSGFVELWAAPIIGVVAGAIVVLSVLAIDRALDGPVGALSAHGVVGVWGRSPAVCSRRRGSSTLPASPAIAMAACPARRRSSSPRSPGWAVTTASRPGVVDKQGVPTLSDRLLICREAATPSPQDRRGRDARRGRPDLLDARVRRAV
jgi:hypothetical protein